MKTSRKIEEIGKGCSRKAFLLENNMIRKEPRYNNEDNDAGCPDDIILEKLIKKYKSQPEVKKVRKLLKNGYYLSDPCRGILAEYLVSLDILEKNRKMSKYFALCLEIKVRKRRNRTEIGIVGFYENAYRKKPVALIDYEKVGKKLGYYVSDIHMGNVINGIIVDYAALSDY